MNYEIEMEEKSESESDNSDDDIELFGRTYGEIKSITKSKKKKPKVQRGVKHKLPKDLEGNLKKAETLYIQNDLTHAKEILTELIKLVPSYPSPYMSLSLIEERLGNIPQSQELIYMAAKLSKKDINLWNQVYEAARANNNIDRLIESLTIITQLDNKDIQSMFVLAKMLHEKNQFKKAGDEYHKILQQSPGNTYALYSCIESYKKSNKVNEAIKVIEENKKSLFLQLKSTYENEDNELTNETKRTDILTIIKMFCELYLENNKYNEIIETIEECSQYNSSSPLPLDLAILYGISKLYLKEEIEAENCFNLLFQQPIEMNGDSYLKVGLTYFNLGKINKALAILERLVNINEYNNNEIWVVLAKCYEITNNIEKSIEYYLKLLNGNSKYDISCLHMKLSTLYLRIGNKEQSVLHESLVDKTKLPAIKWMNILSEKDFELEVNQKMTAFINILNDYKSNNRWDEYIDLALALIRGSSMKYDYFKEYQTNEITPYSQDLFTAYSVGKAINIGSVIGENGYIELVETVYNRLYEKKEYKTCSDVIFITLRTYSFSDSESYYRFQCKLIHVSIATGMYKLANTIMRDILSRNKDSYGFWSLFRFIFSRLRQDPKYMVRLLNLYPLNINIITFVAGLSINLINRDNALSEFFTAYRLKPCDPILSLHIGITYLALVNHRKIIDRNEIILKSILFITKYSKLRFPYELINNEAIYRSNNEYDEKENKNENNIPLVIKELEIYYNLGRLYHQLHRYSWAVHHYKSLLYIYDKIVEANDDVIMGYCNQFGIHRYAAYNLCLILSCNNEKNLIRYYRKRYLSV